MAGQGFFVKTLNFMNGWILSPNRITSIAFQNPVRMLKVDTREKFKSLKIPEKPKKPLNPYMQFISDNRIIFLKENPNTKTIEVIKKLAQQWKTVSEEQKLIYKEKFDQQLEVYDTEILKYNRTLTTEQKEALHNFSVAQKKDRQKRKLRKIVKELHKPKRPIGPYLLFIKEQSQSKNVPQNVLMRSIKNEWEKLSEAERQRYKNEYLKEVEKFEVELKNWEQKMLAEGHPELVRVKSKCLEHNPSRILNLQNKNLQ